MSEDTTPTKTTPAQRAARAAQDAKDLASRISVAEARVRNMRDIHQTAQGRVREWATRLAKDGALIGYDIESYVADIRASEEAFVDYARASVEAARLRLEERAEHQSYMATQGRG